MSTADVVYSINDLIGRDGIWDIVLVGIGITGSYLSKNGKLYWGKSQKQEMTPEDIGLVYEHEDECGAKYVKSASV